MKSIITSLLLLTKQGYSAGYDYDELGADWSHHYEMCGTHDQSPINIHSDYALYDKSICEPNLNWTVDYSVHSWKVSNNGHSIAVQPVTRSSWHPNIEHESTVTTKDGVNYTSLSSSYNAIARLPNYFLPEGSDNTEFCLHSFHFHWGLTDGVGSEHLVDDYQWPLEVHFVHYTCNHDHLGEVDFLHVDSSKLDTHELAVVGIFFDITEYDNPAFDAILNYDVLEDIQYPTDSPYANVIDDLYLQDIIPDGLFTDGYYAYEGSLTTPPCTNIVRWHVSNSRSYIGKAQIERFRAMMSSQNITMAPNYREAQHNYNDVYACMDEPVEENVDNALVRAIIWVYSIVILCCMIGMAAYCHWKVAQDEDALDAAEPPKRQRLVSRSSFGDGHASPVSPDGHGHATTGHH